MVGLTPPVREPLRNRTEVGLRQTEPLTSIGHFFVQAVCTRQLCTHITRLPEAYLGTF